MVNSESFEADVDRNDKSEFAPSNSIAESPHSLISIKVVHVNLCQNDFTSEAADSLPISQAFEPTATETDSKCNNAQKIYPNSSGINRVAEGNSLEINKKGPGIYCSLPLERLGDVLIKNKFKEMCLFCDREFVNAGLKQKHMERCHSVKYNRRSSTRRAAQKSVSCMFCNKANVTDGNLNMLLEHLILVHPSKYFGCLECEIRFQNLHLLEKHRIKIHGRIKSPEKTIQVESISKAPDIVTSEPVINDNTKNSKKNYSATKQNKIAVLSKKSGIRRCLPITRQHTKILKTKIDKSNSKINWVSSSKYKKISDHSNDNNLKTDSLTFDDVFDKTFFNKVKCNIQENLSNHIDGKLFKNRESESRISSFQKTAQHVEDASQASSQGLQPIVSLQTTPEFDYFEPEIDYGLKPAINDGVHYKYFTRLKYQEIIAQNRKERDLSKLDMSTQMAVKTRQQNVLRLRQTEEEKSEYLNSDECKLTLQIEELNEILDKRGPVENLQEEAIRKVALEKLKTDSSSENFLDISIVIDDLINNVFSHSNETISCNTAPALPKEMASQLNLVPNTNSSNNKDENSTSAEFSGEWARSKIYVCAACGIKKLSSKLMVEHKKFFHENIWCQHYEFVGNQGELYPHLSIPHLGKVGALEVGNCDMNLYKKSDSRACSKCNKQFNCVNDLHRHILECGGDWSWLLARKRYKYKPYGSRNRKKKRLLVHLKALKNKPKGESTEKRKYNKKFNGPRSKPSDAETIQRMLANLPAKRARKMINISKDSVKKPSKKQQTKLKKAAAKTKLVPQAKSVKGAVLVKNTGSRARRLLRSNSSNFIENNIGVIKSNRRKNRNKENSINKHNAVGNKSKSKPPENSKIRRNSEPTAKQSPIKQKLNKSDSNLLLLKRASESESTESIRKSNRINKKQNLMKETNSVPIRNKTAKTQSKSITKLVQVDGSSQNVTSPRNKKSLSPISLISDATYEENKDCKVTVGNSEDKTASANEQNVSEPDLLTDKIHETSLSPKMKGRIRNQRGLNDCIAMLTSKLLINSSVYENDSSTGTENCESANETERTSADADLIIDYKQKSRLNNSLESTEKHKVKSRNRQKNKKVDCCDTIYPTNLDNRPNTNNDSIDTKMLNNSIGLDQLNAEASVHTLNKTGRQSRKMKCTGTDTAPQTKSKRKYTKRKRLLKNAVSSDTTEESLEKQKTKIENLEINCEERFNDADETYLNNVIEINKGVASREIMPINDSTQDTTENNVLKVNMANKKRTRRMPKLDIIRPIEAENIDTSREMMPLIINKIENDVNTKITETDSIINNTIENLLSVVAQSKAEEKINNTKYDIFSFVDECQTQNDVCNITSDEFSNNSGKENISVNKIVSTKKLVDIRKDNSNEFKANIDFDSEDELPLVQLSKKTEDPFESYFATIDEVIKQSAQMTKNQAVYCDCLIQCFKNATKEWNVKEADLLEPNDCLAINCIQLPQIEKINSENKQHNENLGQIVIAKKGKAQKQSVIDDRFESIEPKRHEIKKRERKKKKVQAQTEMKDTPLMQFAIETTHIALEKEQINTLQFKKRRRKAGNKSNSNLPVLPEPERVQNTLSEGKRVIKRRGRRKKILDNITPIKLNESGADQEAPLHVATPAFEIATNGERITKDGLSIDLDAFSKSAYFDVALQSEISKAKFPFLLEGSLPLIINSSSIIDSDSPPSEYTSKPNKSENKKIVGKTRGRKKKAIVLESEEILNISENNNIKIKLPKRKASKLTPAVYIEDDVKLAQEDIPVELEKLNESSSQENSNITSCFAENCVENSQEESRDDFDEKSIQEDEILKSELEILNGTITRRASKRKSYSAQCSNIVQNVIDEDFPGSVIENILTDSFIKPLFIQANKSRSDNDSLLPDENCFVSPIDDNSSSISNAESKISNIEESSTLDSVISATKMRKKRKSKKCKVKKPVITSITDNYCDICNKTFTHAKSLMIHKGTLRHISKLSKLEALEMAKKQVESPSETSRLSLATQSSLPLSPKSPFKLVDIISDVLSKPVDNLITLQSRCKSLGERKSFDSFPSSDGFMTDTAADVIVEKQISLLENMIEDNRMNFRCSPETDFSPSFSSPKQEISFTHNTNIITSLIKPILDDNLSRAAQYEEISDDSNSSQVRYDEQKSRKALNRDEELFLECCSLLKSSSENMQDACKKPINPPAQFLNRFGLRNLDEYDWLEHKNLPSMSDNYCISNSNPINLKMNGFIDNSNGPFFPRPIFEDISTESEMSSDSNNCLDHFNDDSYANEQFIDERSIRINSPISPNVECAVIPEEYVEPQKEDEMEEVQENFAEDRNSSPITLDLSTQHSLPPENLMSPASFSLPDTNENIHVRFSPPLFDDVSTNDHSSFTLEDSKPSLSFNRETSRFEVNSKNKEEKRFLTKGALKEFDGVKVSIPIKRLNMSKILKQPEVGESVDTIISLMEQSYSISGGTLFEQSNQFGIPDLSEQESWLESSNTVSRNNEVKNVSDTTERNEKNCFEFDERKYEQTNNNNTLLRINEQSLNIKTFGSGKTTISNDDKIYKENFSADDLTFKNNKFIKNKSDKLGLKNSLLKSFGNKLGAKVRKPKVFKKPPKIVDAQKKSYDIYDFEETQDNIDAFSTECNTLPIYHRFTNKQEANNKPLKKVSAKKNITKNKCMIMGRIFKNAIKPKFGDAIKSIPSIQNDELVENYVQDCQKQELQSKLTEDEMNALFDKLLNETKVESNFDAASEKSADSKVSKTMRGRKRRTNCDDSSDKDFSIKAPPKSKRGNPTDSINMEQELKECIGVASRKSQRTCTSGKQNVLTEYWSSDDSNLTEPLLPLLPPPTPSPPPPPILEKIIEPVKKMEPPAVQCKEPLQITRRKRSTVDTLYYWSSSSDDETTSIVEVKPVREDEFEDDRPLQHGWIVGESTKKLVTMLAQAKGKKIVDSQCVKKAKRKRTSV